jgi:hypothetical protein
MKRIGLAAVVLTAACALSGVTPSASIAGPFWHVNGTRLAQGTAKQLKLQAKGTTVFKEKAFGLVTVEIECKSSVSEGATIENSNTQGQGKGRLTFTQCTTITPTEEACRIVEPITTNQTKSYLAFNGTKPENKQQKYVDVFEPQQSPVFVVLHFLKSCGGVFKELAIEGAVAAEVLPIEKESQESLLSFPAEPITVVVHEQQERKIGLTIAGEPTVFSDAYGARLATNERWGVFGQ